MLPEYYVSYVCLRKQPPALPAPSRGRPTPISTPLTEPERGALRFRARVEVRLKPGLTDAEGLFARSSLRDLGFDVEDVRVGKVYYITFNAEGLEEARREVDSMCRRLLANPEVKDDYDFTVEPAQAQP